MKHNQSLLLLGGLGVASFSTLMAKEPLPMEAMDSKEIAKIYLEAFGECPDPVNYDGVRPNILFITSDQHSWMSMGYNDPDLKTPNLDRLAQKGVVFDRAYTVNPVSTPTRASMITGLYPSQHGAYALGTKLPENVPTIGHYLSNAGYNTALVGKAHFMPLAGDATYPSLEAYPILQSLDFWREYNGPFYGFEDACLARNHGDESHVGQHYALWMEDKLESEGRSRDEWKGWFIDPSSTKFAKFAERAELIYDEYGARGKKQLGIWNIPEEYHLNAFIADITNRKMDEYTKEGEPFFIWASFFDPHPPYLVPEPWATMYNPDDMTLPDVPEDDMDDMPYHYRATQGENSAWGKAYVEDNQGIHGFHLHNATAEKHRRDKAVYYGMISMMDKYIGKILDNLEQSGELENTIVIFTTDHGHHIGTHNLQAKGGFAYEEDLRIPFIASWPGRYPESKRTDALVSIVDLAPTLLNLAGYESIPTMAGVNLDPLFSGEVDKVREWVIAENHFQRTKFYQKSYIEKRYKITWYMTSDEGELFDLESDPHEYTNLWDNPDYAELKSRLLLRAMQADMRTEPCHMPRLGPA